MTLEQIEEAIEEAISNYDGGEHSELQFVSLIDRLPSLHDVPTGEELRWEQLGVELFYRANRPQELVEWIQQSASGKAFFWEVCALFDLAEYRRAVARGRLIERDTLLPWARAKLEEIELCCVVYADPAAVTRARVDELRARRNSLEMDQRTLMFPLLDATTSDAFRAVPDGVRRYLLDAFEDELNDARTRAARAGKGLK